MEAINRQENDSNRLKKVVETSFNVLAKMRRNEFVSLESLCKICSAIDCDISDVMEFKKHETAWLCNYIYKWIYGEYA